MRISIIINASVPSGLTTKAEPRRPICQSRMRNRNHNRRRLRRIVRQHHHLSIGGHAPLDCCSLTGKTLHTRRFRRNYCACCVFSNAAMRCFSLITTSVESSMPCALQSMSIARAVSNCLKLSACRDANACVRISLFRICDMQKLPPRPTVRPIIAPTMNCFPIFIFSPVFNFQCPVSNLSHLTSKLRRAAKSVNRECGTKNAIGGGSGELLGITIGFNVFPIYLVVSD